MPSYQRFDLLEKIIEISIYTPNLIVKNYPKLKEIDTIFQASI